MKPSLIRTLLFRVFQLGGQHSSAIAGFDHVGAGLKHEKLLELIREHEAQLEWAEAQKVADDPLVHDTLAGFSADPTADNATILVQHIVAAYLKG